MKGEPEGKRNYASEIIKTINEAYKEHEKANAELSRLDLEFTDLCHAFELLKLNAADMAKIGKEMKRNRMERRDCKNEIERLHTLVKWFEDNKNQISCLKGISTHTDKVIDQQSKRIYTPRVRKDLTKRFREGLK